MNADVEQLAAEFCKENGIAVTMSREMPAGYENAYGTYDVAVNTLFLNPAMLRDAPEYEKLYYLYHELRHAVQYLCPGRFGVEIRESLAYVVLYNGICFRLVGNVWQECELGGPEEYFTRAYLSLPYEMDANAFAYEKVKELCGDSAELRELYGFWMPKERMAYPELETLFRRIDAALDGPGG